MRANRTGTFQEQCQGSLQISYFSFHSQMYVIYPQYYFSLLTFDVQMWCANVDQQEIIDDVLNNPHSPLSIRVRGSLANFDQFTAAFGCPVGSKMNPNDKCILW